MKNFINIVGFTFLLVIITYCHPINKIYAEVVEQKSLLNNAKNSSKLTYKTASSKFVKATRNLNDTVDLSGYSKNQKVIKNFTNTLLKAHPELPYVKVKSIKNGLVTLSYTMDKNLIRSSYLLSDNEKIKRAQKDIVTTIQNGTQTCNLFYLAGTKLLGNHIKTILWNPIKQYDILIKDYNENNNVIKFTYYDDPAVIKEAFTLSLDEKKEKVYQLILSAIKNVNPSVRVAPYMLDKPTLEKIWCDVLTAHTEFNYYDYISRYSSAEIQFKYKADVTTIKKVEKLTQKEKKAYAIQEILEAVKNRKNNLNIWYVQSNEYEDYNEIAEQISEIFKQKQYFYVNVRNIDISGELELEYNYSKEEVSTYLKMSDQELKKLAIEKIRTSILNNVKLTDLSFYSKDNTTIIKLVEDVKASNVDYFNSDPYEAYFGKIEFYFDNPNPEFLKSKTLKIQNAMHPIINEASKLNTNFDKVKYIHDYVVNLAHYDYENYLNDTVPMDSYSPYGILINKTGVCNGYALTMYFLLNYSGVKTEYVSGVVNGNGHAWNLVNLDGEYYYLDATWDDPPREYYGKDVLSYDYFLVPGEVLARDHEWNMSDYPSATSTKYNYLYSR
ncbi:transglutaminase domain-containing protein [Bacillus sp. JJ664]